MKYDTVFPAFADRVVIRLAAIGAVGAAAAFLKWEVTVGGRICLPALVFHILFFLYMKQRITWEKEERDAVHRPDGRRACRLPAFCGSGAGRRRLFVDTSFHSRFPGGLIVTVPCYYAGQGNSVE